MQKRIARGGSVLKLLLSFVLVVGLMPSLAFAGQESSADEAEYGSEGVSLAVSSGWTQWDTLEWKVDDGGCFVLRPLGGAACGSSSKILYFTSLGSGATSFRIEGEISLGGLTFWGASDLREIDLTGLDTSTAAINAGHMFDGCSSLESIEFGDVFDTSNVTYLLFTFRGCSSLTSLDLSGWDTSNVTDMYHMFDGCSSLTSLDLSSFDTSKAVRMGGMFDGCTSLRYVSLGEKFSFCGSGTERQCSLPTPSGDGLSGKWVSIADGVTSYYDADEVPNNVAAYYEAGYQALWNGFSVYRMYNPITSEHLFTTDMQEYISLTAHDWRQEGTAWASPIAGTKGVYRLYNAALGSMAKMSHHYTTDKAEADNLVKNWGWVYDNGGAPIFYSAEDDSGTFYGTSPVYRLYNDGLSAHHYTLDKGEYDSLIANQGWSGEAVAFYAGAGNNSIIIN